LPRNDALLVNPHDVEGVADAIYRAHTMGPGELQTRMSSLRRVIRSRDIYWWVDSFLRAVFAHDLEDFPTLDNYVPPYEIS
jgi:trehalose-6-phosphate synthase